VERGKRREHQGRDRFYLAPAILDERADRFEMLGARMVAAAKRNNAAKAAIETALFDAVGKSFDLPAVALLGGIARDRISVFWTLASGDAAQEIEEVEAKLSAHLHNNFKVKIGAQTADDDLARALAGWRRPSTSCAGSPGPESLTGMNLAPSEGYFVISAKEPVIKSLYLVIPGRGLGYRKQR
jgi:hypothetical protein